MEGNNSISRPSDMLIRIRDFTRSRIKGVCKEQSSFVVHIDRFRNYCTDSSGHCCCSSYTAKGKELITLQRECHVHRLDVLLRVLLIVQQLLQENKHGSKRDIFYMHPSVFREQSVVDRAINDICILLQCRHNLNVVCVCWERVTILYDYADRLVMGWLRFSEAGRIFDCINSPNSAHPVPVNVEEVKDIMSVAKYILIVEKESVFQRLSNDQFCKKNQCIVITGRGYPDVPTRRSPHYCACIVFFILRNEHNDSMRIQLLCVRLFWNRFLRLIIEKLCLPTYCLVDCDPYGFDILTTYRFGSMQMAFDAKFLRISNIQWIGVFISDVDRFSLPQHCLLPLTNEDKSRTEALLRRCYLEREVPEWRLELELLLQRGVKFEIEALSAHSLSFLSEVYVPSKLKGELQI
nr:PREDICTED: meiotic recombination protein SPO11-1-like isoform X2 [Daucus carota subsp. sativus]